MHVLVDFRPCEFLPQIPRCSRGGDQAGRRASLYLWHIIPLHFPHAFALSSICCFVVPRFDTHQGARGAPLFFLRSLRTMFCIPHLQQAVAHRFSSHRSTIRA